MFIMKMGNYSPLESSGGFVSTHYSHTTIYIVLNISAQVPLLCL